MVNFQVGMKDLIFWPLKIICNYLMEYSVVIKCKKNAS